MTTHGPLYLRVVEQLRLRIAAGNLGAGAAMPPERLLADELKISRPTLRSAIQTLIHEGLLESVQGRGTFVTAVPPPSRSPAPLLHLVLSSPTGSVSETDAFVRTLTTCFAALPPQLSAGVRMLVTDPTPAAVTLAVQAEDPALLRGGVVFVGIAAPEAILLAHLRLHGIPAALIGEAAQTDDAIISLRADHASTGAAAASHLIAHGRRHILLLDGPWEHHPCRLRREGFLGAGQPPAVVLSTVETVGWDGRRSRAALLAALAHDPFPDAIVAGGDTCLRSVLAVLAERGLQVPEDVAVVGVGIPDPGAIPGPHPVTCWQPDLTVLARRAAEALMAGRITGHAAAPVTILVPDHLRVGRSCGCVEPRP